MNTRRGRILSRAPGGRGPVLHWMHRDHRLRDNWSLLHAWDLARGLGVPLVSAHCLDPSYPGAEAAHFRFLMEGLGQLERDMAAQGLPLLRLLGDPPAEIVRLARALDAAAVVADFDPLRHKRAWLTRAASALPCPLHEADARNVVPCFEASDKPEYMARTIRPKIHRLLPEYLTDFPEPPAQPAPAIPPGLGRSAGEIEEAFPRTRAAGIPGGFTPGERAGRAALEGFLAHRLHGYDENRNDPARDGQSGLSPWLHFGMLSAQRAALSAASSGAPPQDTEAFLEELIVRRELADNFCLHHQDYDSTACFPQWAARTLEKHAGDPRPALYSPQELEQGRTQDPAWNAAQLEMVRGGKMHGYMRMYWGKKLLEWGKTPREAFYTALSLNNRYCLDGRDPNSFAGIAWCFGKHDRPWGERDIFGNVRYMNAKGLERKFDTRRYIRRVEEMEEASGRA